MLTLVLPCRLRLHGYGVYGSRSVGHLDTSKHQIPTFSREVSHETSTRGLGIFTQQRCSSQGYERFTYIGGDFIEPLIVIRLL